MALQAHFNDVGLVIERGNVDNAFIGFDESEDKFTLGTGSFTGASTGNLSITLGTLVANIEATTVTLGGVSIYYQLVILKQLQTKH